MLDSTKSDVINQVATKDAVIPDYREDPVDGEGSLDCALLYLSHGLPAFPVGWDKLKKGWKKPLVGWKRYQTELPTEANLCSWWKQWPFARVGIVTGNFSGLVVVDIDPYKGGSIEGLNLPATLISKTGGGGWHYLYRHHGKCPIPNATNWPRAGVDIRGDGGFIVAPPSLHVSGERYEWPMGFDPSLIADCPAWLIERDLQKSNIYDLLNGVSVGQRNDAATRIIGLILSDLPKVDWESHGWPQSKNWNQKNKEPLAEEELRSVFNSIASREDKKRQEGKEGQDEENDDPPKASRRKRIAREFLELSGNELFRDSFGKSYVKLKRDDHTELWPCQGGEIRREIGLFWYDRAGEPAGGEDVTSITNTLDAKAQRDGKLINVDLRVAKNAIDDVNAIFYDLADTKWQCIVITKDSWSIKPHTGVYFQRYKHTQEQVVPVPGGDIRELFKFVNIKKPDEQLLLLCHLVSCFIPDIAHPILGLNGHKGSSKSTIMRMLKTIIDPSPLFASSFPKEQNELVITFSQNWTTAFDNVSEIPDWLSDILCKVCTGDAFSKRKLYTDEDAHIVSYQRCVLLNGINNPVNKPDLLDRMIILWIESISKEERKPLTELWKEFLKALPNILGGVFDALARAFALKDTVNRDNLSRLADFDLWSRAIAKALGYTEQDFIRAISANTETQNDEAIRQSPIALLLLNWAETTDQSATLENTATELLKWLLVRADTSGINTRSREWPKSGAALSRKINEIAPNLLEHGIKILRTGDNRKILIQKVPKNGVNTVNTEAVISIFGGEVVDPDGNETPSSTIPF